jgi:putative oxidoreductase
MLRKLTSPTPLAYSTGLAFLRIMTGLLMAYHGLEIFDRSAMVVYLEWDLFKKMPAAEFMLYLGKGLEFFTGVFLAIGFLTRIAALFMAINMLFICFFIGNGRFYYEDQHPFLFALLAIVFFFAGPVKWSVDQRLFK